MTDVVVVGAGLAGLTAARAMVRAGLDVVVLEARSRVGGRTENGDLGGGEVVELGGQWIGPTQDRIAALAAELGVATFPTHADGAKLYEDRGRVRRFTGDLPRLAPHELADLAIMRLRQWRLTRRVDPAAPWDAPDAGALDGQTAWSWAQRSLRTRIGRGVTRLSVQAIWAAEPEELSALHLGFYMASGGGLGRLEATRGGAQQDRFVGGSAVVSERLAAELGDRVRLSRPVRRIEQAAVDGRVTVRADGGEAVTADAAVVTVPPGVAGTIVHEPGLPALRDGLQQRLVMGSVIKTHVVYPGPFWRAEGLSGEAFSLDGPVGVVYDNSPPGGAPGVLLAFLEGAHARELGRLPAAERQAAVVAALGRLYGPRALHPERVIDRDWTAEVWTRGCYGAFLPPGAWTGYGRALREPVGRVHWAGAETATRHAGYMDGAVRSGEAAARAVLVQLH